MSGRARRSRTTGAQIRAHLGFRECTVADAEKLTRWLAAAVCEAERRPELVRDEMLSRTRAERVEPPAGSTGSCARPCTRARDADRPGHGQAAGRRSRPAAGPGRG
ncbi:DUF4158 domain-containing protein [Micromonospora sp. SH-82]|uniref:DUF4158 domain-containing protein n=1 Tax=Micromonospora sp. SH-82 TaxID=3132938 RepID=UPI003EC0EA81